MGAWRRFAAKLGILGELFRFLGRNKRWWMIPLVAVLVIVVLALVFSQSSVIGPFIYSLF